MSKALQLGLAGQHVSIRGGSAFISSSKESCVNLLMKYERKNATVNRDVLCFIDLQSFPKNLCRIIAREGDVLV